MTDFTAPPRTDKSILSELASELEAKLDEGTVILQVPDRNGLSVEFSKNIDVAEIAQLRKNAVPKGTPQEVAEFQFSQALLVAKCRSIIKGTTVLMVNDDEPMTFTSRELHDLLGTIGAEDTVEKFYAKQPHVTATANALLMEAGYADQVVRDPTRR